MGALVKFPRQPRHGSQVVVVPVASLGFQKVNRPFRALCQDERENDGQRLGRHLASAPALADFVQHRQRDLPRAANFSPAGLPLQPSLAGRLASKLIGALPLLFHRRMSSKSSSVGQQINTGRTRDVGRFTQERGYFTRDKSRGVEDARS